MQNTNQKIIMGIETSCDDTAVAIINSNKEILSNVVINQNSNLSKLTNRNSPSKMALINARVLANEMRFP